MEIYSSADIKRIAAVHAENIDVFAGKGDNTRLIVKPGLRLRHILSGLVYTVLDIDISDQSDPKILCNRAGRNLIILKDEFKNYERQ